MFKKMTPEKIERLKDQFTKLKRSAQHPDDIALWFKLNPAAIPRLPEEYHDKVRVNVVKNYTNYDFEKKTAFVECNFEFFLPSVDNYEQQKTIAQITGLSFDFNLDTENAYRTEYKQHLDACEWRFVALDVLCDIEDHELNSSVRVALFKNILETQFPHQTWDAFLALRNADLLPASPGELGDLLRQQSAQASSLPNQVDLSV